jgi:hypothetical protein
MRHDRRRDGCGAYSTPSPRGGEGLCGVLESSFGLLPARELGYREWGRARPLQ